MAHVSGMRNTVLSLSAMTLLLLLAAVVGTVARDSQPARASGDQTGLIGFYRIGSGSQSDVWTMDLNGSNEFKVADASDEGLETAFAPTISPDGTQVAYQALISTSSNIGEIRIRNADGSGTFATIYTGDRFAGGPDWSPGGTKIAHVCDNFTVCITEIGGSTTTILNSPHSVGGISVWSPDQQYLLYHPSLGPSQTRVWAVRISDGTVYELTSDFTQAGRWSPDGSQIAFNRNNDGLWVMDISIDQNGDLVAGAEVEITTVPGNTRPVGFIDDDTLIVWNNGNKQTYSVNLDGSDLTPIGTPSGIAQVSMDVYVEPEPEPLVVTLDGPTGLNEGDTWEGTLTVEQPDGNTDPHNYSVEVDWGDGTVEQFEFVGQSGSPVLGTEADLPASAQQLAAVGVDGKVYAVGGWNSTSLTDLYIGTPDETGAISSWEVIADSLSGFSVHQTSLAEINGYLYAVANTSSPVVIRAAISDLDGPGDWTMVTAALPEPLAVPALVSNGNDLYVINGFTPGSSHPAQTDIYVGTAVGGGDITSWTHAGNTNGPREGAGAFIANGDLYVVGGYDNKVNDASDVYWTEIERFTINGDRTLTSQGTAGNLITGRHAFAGFMIGDQYFALGGFNGHVGGRLASGEVLTVESDGTVTVTATPFTLPTARNVPGGAAIGNTGYIIGGTDSVEGILNDVLSVTVPTSTTALSHTYVDDNPSGTPDDDYTISVTVDEIGSSFMPLGGWAAHSVLNAPRPYSPVVFTDNYVYTSGGGVNSQGLPHQSSVERASIASDEVTNPWASVSSLNQARSGHSGASWQGGSGQWYVIYGGGAAGDHDRLSSIEVAIESVGGSLSAFDSSYSLPQGISSMSFIVNDNCLYSIGGFGTGGSVTDVRAAVLSEVSDGQGGLELDIGTWNSVSTLPRNFGTAQAAQTDTHVYIGENGVTQPILRAEFESGCELSDTWASLPASGPAFADNHRFTGMAVANGRMYVAGGSPADLGGDPNKRSDEVRSAEILPNGDLGTWEAEPAMTKEREHGFLFTVGDHLYMLGGQKPHQWANYNDVERAALPADGPLPVVNSGSTAHVVNVANLNPGITAVDVQNQVTNPGVPVQLEVTFGDAGVDDTHSVIIEWDDDSPDTFLPSVTSPFIAEHTYSEPGDYSPSFVITDDDLGTDGAGASVHINAPPVVTITPDVVTVEQDKLFEAEISFTDPDSTSWSAVIEWGDNTPDTVVDPAESSFDISHVYNDLGNHTVTVTVTDELGASGEDTASIEVIIPITPIVLFNDRDDDGIDPEDILSDPHRVQISGVGDFVSGDEVLEAQLPAQCRLHRNSVYGDWQTCDPAADDGDDDELLELEFATVEVVLYNDEAGDGIDESDKLHDPHRVQVSNVGDFVTGDVFHVPPTADITFRLHRSSVYGDWNGPNGGNPVNFPAGETIWELEFATVEVLLYNDRDNDGIDEADKLFDPHRVQVSNVGDFVTGDVFHVPPSANITFRLHRNSVYGDWNAPNGGSAINFPAGETVWELEFATVEVVLYNDEDGDGIDEADKLFDPHKVQVSNVGDFTTGDVFHVPPTADITFRLHRNSVYGDWNGPNDGNPINFPAGETVWELEFATVEVVLFNDEDGDGIDETDKLFDPHKVQVSNVGDFVTGDVFHVPPTADITFRLHRNSVYGDWNAPNGGSAINFPAGDTVWELEFATVEVLLYNDHGNDGIDEADKLFDPHKVQVSNVGDFTTGDVFHVPPSANITFRLHTGSVYGPWNEANGGDPVNFPAGETVWELEFATVTFTFDLPPAVIDQFNTQIANVDTVPDGGTVHLPPGAQVNFRVISGGWTDDWVTHAFGAGECTVTWDLVDGVTFTGTACLP